MSAFLDKFKSGAGSANTATPTLRVIEARTAAVPHSQPYPWDPAPYNGDFIAWVNATHFIASTNGVPAIWREGTDPATGYPRLACITQAELSLELAQYTVLVATGAGTMPRPLALAWLRDRRRREYDGGIAMVPLGERRDDTYYLFQGFRTQPRAGNPALILDHIDIICSRVELVREYLLNWLAYIVQNPGKRPEVCVVMPGPEGAGKGTIAKIMKAIFGPHFLHLSNARHLTGNFNGHLMNALFVFVDESYWSGDKSAEGVFKALVSEDEIVVEKKGREAFQMPNHMAFFVATNNDYAAPASANARRWFVVPAPYELLGKHDYFTRLHDHIENGGAAAFLDYLLKRDISRFNPRVIPKTQGLNTQKILHMAALDRWLLNALESGIELGGGDWLGESAVGCDAAMASFSDYCKASGLKAYGIDSRAIGKRLNEVFKCGPANARVGGQLARRRAWRLPDIEQARQLAASAFGLHEYEWGQA